jgi:hypothetical protein
MTKHTPGPWQIKSDYEPLSVVGNVDGPDNGQYRYTPICEVEPTLFPDENAANARLIAEAPELLAALRSAALDIEETYEMLAGGHTPIISIGAWGRLDRMRKLLAKATGAQP